MSIFRSLFFLFFFTTIHAQTTLKLVDSIPLKADHYVGTDYNNFHYHFSNTILTKVSEEEHFEYSNFLYGNISSVDITNPLQLVVFYREFNVVVVLDSRLNELHTTQLPYDISYVAKGTVNHFWLYRPNTQVVENFNYKSDRVVARSQPLKIDKIFQFSSTENFLYLNTGNKIFVIDYLGNLVDTIEESNVTYFLWNNRDLYLLRDNKLLDVSNKKSYVFPSVNHISKFYIANNKVYIYDKEHILIFSFPKK